MRPEFESLQAAEALKTGGHMDALKVSLGLNDFPEPEVKEMYEVEKFPQPADLQAVTQVCPSSALLLFTSKPINRSTDHPYHSK